jgi:hypothetical protein
LKTLASIVRRAKVKKMLARAFRWQRATNELERGPNLSMARLNANRPQLSCSSVLKTDYFAAKIGERSMVTAFQTVLVCAAFFTLEAPPTTISRASSWEYKIVDVSDKSERVLRDERERQESVLAWNREGENGWQFVSAPSYKIGGITGVGEVRHAIYEYYRRERDPSLRKKWEYKIVDVSEQLPRDDTRKVDVGVTLNKEGADDWHLCTVFALPNDETHQRTYLLLAKEKR